jgi:predicted MFS family arabinose efflux permease
VPLGLVGFGIGALAGTLVGGRIGDVSPHATTIAAPAATTVLLLAICLLSGFAAPMIALVVLLGLFGLGANPAARARSSPCSPPRRGPSRCTSSTAAPTGSATRICRCRPSRTSAS